MKKVKKIKVLKPKMKEVEKEEIEELTSSEIPLSQDEVEEVVEPVEQVSFGNPAETFVGVAQDTEGTVGRAPVESGGENVGGGVFYANSEEQTRPEYSPVEDVPTLGFERFKGVSIGKDFATQRQTTSSYPDAEQIERKLTKEDDGKRDYETARGRGRAERKMPWEG